MAKALTWGRFARLMAWILSNLSVISKHWPLFGFGDLISK